MALDATQLRAYIYVLNKRKSILLTSEAGCGKSFTISKIVHDGKYSGIQIGVTAMTGSAAVIIGGKTLHSFLGIGLGTKEVPELVAYTKYKLKKVYNLIRKVDILVLDEVSMLDDVLCDKISYYLQAIRGNTEPFGGLQMLFCGDLAQLKPVKGDYCFKSQEWQRLNPKIFTLTTQHRQAGDTIFQQMLSRLRVGQVTDADYELLRRCLKTKFPEGIEPTHVYPLNVNVDAINKTRFDEVCLSATPERIKKYVTTYSNPQMKKVTGIHDEVTLCPGLQVMITFNIPNTNLVNGTRGRVVATYDTTVNIRLVTGQEVPITYYELNPEDSKDFIRFMPLKLAYAVSCHKTQGMTLDCMQVDLGKSIFEYGQAYTALSRAKSLDSVKITKLCRSSFKTHPDVLEFYAPVTQLTHHLDECQV